MKRRSAYKWMHQTLPDLPRHIGEMDVEQCAEVVRAVSEVRR